MWLLLARTRKNNQNMKPKLSPIICAWQPNQHWTAKPNQTGMAPQTKSELTIPSKPNQTVFNQTQSKEFYQSKLNQFKPKPYKQNKNQPNLTKPKPTKPNRI